MTHPQTCLIIGGGIAGLLAGTVLQQNGVNVTIVDKGRGYGGRMANRRMKRSLGRADHGAQFFTVRSPIFQKWVDEWLAAEVVAVWTNGFDNQDGHPRYRGVPGMTAIAKYLAHDLTVHREAKVTRVERVEGIWQISLEDQAPLSAESLILTPPMPQSLALLDAGSVQLPTKARNALESIAFDPCFAVMVSLEGKSGIPAPGGVQVRGEPISWIGDNFQKGVSPTTTVTIHAGPDFTKKNLNADRAWVGHELVKAAESRGWLRASQISEMQVHRWLYAQPTVLHPERTLLLDAPAPIAFAGDGFKEARVEGAALSGLAAAEAILSRG